jgi:hypothetical protein
MLWRLLMTSRCRSTLSRRTLRVGDYLTRHLFVVSAKLLLEGSNRHSSMAENEYSESVNPEALPPPSVDSKEPKFSCTTNKLVVGVAAVAPVAWSSDGAWLVHATGDHSLHVCHKPGSSSAFKVHGVLVGHSETVTCLVMQDISCDLFIVTDCLLSQAFHPMEPTLLVSGGADGLWFWNVAECRCTPCRFQSLSCKTYLIYLQCSEDDFKRK